MSFHSFDQTVDVETVIALPMSRDTLNVKCFEEFSGKRDCINETTEVKETIFVVANGFIVEAESC
jgi:hypothetical protein